MAFMGYLPVDLVLVRHGESEGNLYKRSPPGEARDRVRDRHTSQFRLTDLGRVQSKRTGKILMDRYELRS